MEKKDLFEEERRMIIASQMRWHAGDEGSVSAEGRTGMSDPRNMRCSLTAAGFGGEGSDGIGDRSSGPARRGVLGNGRTLLERT